MMKKWVLTIAVASALSACSSDNESKQSAGDYYQKSEAELPAFAPLASGGVTLPQQSGEYALPTVQIKRANNVDIRPPSAPLALISNSITQFDGQRALIAFPADKNAVYNIRQVERLLREQEIEFKSEGNKLETDWASTGRADDVGDTKVRYLIEQVDTPDASGLFVSVLEMQRDGTVYTPNLNDKQRYSSDRLNQLIGELNAAYRKQQQELGSASVGALAAQIANDNNGHTALVISAPFAQAWQKLSEKLPHLGFNTKEENAARGYREMT